MTNPNLVLPASRAKWLWVALGSALFVVAALAPLPGKSLGISVSGGVFFGFSLAIAVLSLAPNSSYLKLYDDRLEYRVLYLTRVLAKREIANFSVWDGGVARPMVRVTLVAGTVRHHMLPDTYGKSADELAKMLGIWLRGDGPVLSPN